jgi:hypothetical protein
MAGDVTDSPEVLSAGEKCDGLGRKGRKRGETAEESRDYEQRHFRRDFATQRKQLDEKPDQIAADEIGGKCRPSRSLQSSRLPNLWTPSPSLIQQLRAFDMAPGGNPELTGPGKR